LAFLCVPDDDGLLVPLYDGDRFLTWLDVGDQVQHDYTWEFRSWGDIPLLGDTFSIGKALRERNCKDLTVIWNLAGIFGDRCLGGLGKIRVYTESKDSLPSIPMLAKLTAKNQITLPKAITQAIKPTEYFDIKVESGQIVLTPVKIQKADAVRAKLAALNLSEQDILDAVAWSRTQATL
jgi:hypothetical protein